MHASAIDQTLICWYQQKQFWPVWHHNQRVFLRYLKLRSMFATLFSLWLPGAHIIWQHVKVKAMQTPLKSHSGRSSLHKATCISTNICHFIAVNLTPLKLGFTKMTGSAQQHVFVMHKVKFGHQDRDWHFQLIRVPDKPLVYHPYNYT